jgi:hypothetical protein
MMFRLDSGRIPRLNYNKVLRKARHRISNDGPQGIIMTQEKARNMWRVAQDVNGVVEPQMAIRRRADRDRTREGLI